MGNASCRSWTIPDSVGFAKLGAICPLTTGHSPNYSDGEVHNQPQKTAIRESNNSNGKDEGERQVHISLEVHSRQIDQELVGQRWAWRQRGP